MVDVRASVWYTGEYNLSGFLVFTFLGVIRMDFHDVANIFPMMGDEEFTALVADVKVNGLLTPVWTYQGKIIDGRNRYKACMQLGIEPQFREWKGDDAGLLSFILSLNLQRRHLSSSQKAILAAEIETYLATQAKKNMSQGGKGLEKIPSPIHAARQAAALVGTNAHYVTDAKRVMGQAPEIVDAVRRGIISIPDAVVVARLPEQHRQAVLDTVGKVDGFIHPDRTKQAIKLVQKAAEEEAWQRRHAEYEAQMQAQIAACATPEYQQREKERRKETERQVREAEEQQRVERERQAAYAEEMRAAFNDPGLEQERALLYAAAREVNMHMRQAVLAYIQFSVRFNELAGYRRE